MQLKVKRFSCDECRIVFDFDNSEDILHQSLLTIDKDLIEGCSISCIPLDKYKDNTKIKSYHLYVKNDEMYVKSNMIELISTSKKIASYLLNKLSIKSLNIIACDEMLFMEVNDRESVDM